MRNIVILGGRKRLALKGKDALSQIRMDYAAAAAVISNV